MSFGFRQSRWNDVFWRWMLLQKARCSLQENICNQSILYEMGPRLVCISVPVQTCCSTAKSGFECIEEGWVRRERHQAECLLNSFDFFIKLLSTLIIWLAVLRALQNSFLFLKRKYKILLISVLQDDLDFWPGVNLVTVYNLCTPWGLAAERCLLIHWSKSVQRPSYQAGCLDTRRELLDQMVLPSYSCPRCSVRTKCRTSI